MIWVIVGMNVWDLCMWFVKKLYENEWNKRVKRLLYVQGRMGGGVVPLKTLNCQSFEFITLYFGMVWPSFLKAGHVF